MAMKKLKNRIDREKTEHKKPKNRGDREKTEHQNRQARDGRKSPDLRPTDMADEEEEEGEKRKKKDQKRTSKQREPEQNRNSERERLKRKKGSCCAEARVFGLSGVRKQDFEASSSKHLFDTGGKKEFFFFQFFPQRIFKIHKALALLRLAPRAPRRKAIASTRLFHSPRLIPCDATHCAPRASVRLGAPRARFFKLSSSVPPKPLNNQGKEQRHSFFIDGVKISTMKERSNNVVFD